MQRNPLILLILGFAAVQLGCQHSVPPVPNPLAIQPTEYDPTYHAARNVLRDAGFRLDRSDHRFGVVTTHPKDSPTAVEPFHTDNTTAYQAWQSTVSHLRRTVRVSLETPPDSADPHADPKADPPDSYLLRVEVLIERRQMPTRRLTGSIGRNMFVTLDEVPTELAQRGIAAGYWQPIGRDALLERRLLARITQRASQ